MKAKNIVSGFVVLILNCTAFAQNEVPEVTLDFSKNITQLQLGVKSPTGMLGVSQELALTPHHSLVGNLGLDISGPLLSLGYRYYDQILERHKTKTFLDKCFFVFSCESRPLVGVQISRSFGGRLAFDGNSKDQRDYDIGPSTLINGEFGVQTIFSSGIVSTLAFGYRTPLDQSSVELKSGSRQASDESTIRHWNQGLGFSVGLGYTY